MYVRDHHVSGTARIGTRRWSRTAPATGASGPMGAWLLLLTRRDPPAKRLPGRRLLTAVTRSAAEDRPRLPLVATLRRPT